MLIEWELPERYGWTLWKAQERMLGGTFGPIFKGLSHKYIKRVRGANGRWRYFYQVQHGHGVEHEEHMQVGSKFKHEGGHLEITHDHGDGRVTVKHDETGKTETLHKHELAAKLRAHHEKAIAAHAKNAKLPLTVRRMAPDARAAAAKEHETKKSPHGGLDIASIAEMADRYRVKEAALTPKRIDDLMDGAPFTPAEKTALHALAQKIRGTSGTHADEQDFARQIEAVAGAAAQSADTDHIAKLKGDIERGEAAVKRAKSVGAGNASWMQKQVDGKKEELAKLTSGDAAKPAAEAAPEKPAPKALAESHTYGATLRPPGFATVPKGFTEFGKHADFAAHGTVTYPHALSDEDAKHFDLVKIPSEGEKAKAIDDIAGEMGEYGAEHVELYGDGANGKRAVEAMVGQKIQHRNLHMDRTDTAAKVIAKLGASKPATAVEPGGTKVAKEEPPKPAESEDRGSDILLPKEDRKGVYAHTPNHGEVVKRLDAAIADRVKKRTGKDVKADGLSRRLEAAHLAADGYGPHQSSDTTMDHIGAAATAAAQNAARSATYGADTALKTPVGGMPTSDAKGLAQRVKFLTTGKDRSLHGNLHEVVDAIRERATGQHKGDTEWAATQHKTADKLDVQADEFDAVSEAAGAEPATQALRSAAAKHRQAAGNVPKDADAAMASYIAALAGHREHAKTLEALKAHAPDVVSGKAKNVTPEAVAASIAAAKVAGKAKPTATTKEGDLPAETRKRLSAFVAGADDDRANLKHLHVAGGHAVATNGSRAVIVPAPGAREGLHATSGGEADGKNYGKAVLEMAAEAEAQPGHTFDAKQLHAVSKLNEGKYASLVSGKDGMYIQGEGTSPAMYAAEDHTQEPSTIRVDKHLLHAALAGAKGDVQIHHAGPGKPIVVKRADGERHLIAPIRDAVKSAQLGTPRFIIRRGQAPSAALAKSGARSYLYRREAA